MPAKCDQVIERLSPQFVGIKKMWRPAVFVVDLQFLATAASLTAVVVLVKPLLTLGRPCFGGDVLAVTVAGWFFHGTKNKGAEAPFFPATELALPLHEEPCHDKARHDVHILANL